jgi:thioredoxin
MILLRPASPGRSKTGRRRMSKPQVVSDQNFETEVIKSDTPVLVDFWAAWCGPCRMVAPVLEEIATEQGEKVKIAKLDVDANPITAGRFGVRSIPTMILFKNGREAQRVVGYMPKEKLMQQLQPHIAGTAAA